MKMRPPTGRCWALAEQTFLSMVKDNRIWFGPDGNSRPRKKIFLSEVKGGTAWTWWPHVEVGNNQDSAKELKTLFGTTDLFENPKPTKLLNRILRLGSSSDSLILDFFSGSATTAHAVMQLNAEDGGHRRFIMVQLPEPCAEDSEAAKAGYKNICEIGKERIRRAGKKIAEELAAKNAEIAKDNAQGELGLDNPDNPVNPVEKEIPDIGFRVLKLDSSSLLDVGVTTGEAAQETLALSRIREDRSPEDLLFQMLLETRIPLSDPICTAEVGGNEVFFVGVDMGGSPSPATADAQERVPPEVRENIERAAQAVLDVRQRFMDADPECSLGILYMPDTMPTDLLFAHEKLDALVDKAYGLSPSVTDAERVAHLFRLHAEKVKKTK